MSVAFTREGDAEAAAADLPDRPVSTNPNLVTTSGLAQIDAELAAARSAYAAAQAGGAIAGDRTAMARATRSLRYWSARRATAQLVPPSDGKVVRFGCSVTFLRDDGESATYRITGEDEAEPAAGRIAYVAPAARALLGKGIGDSAVIAGREVEIVGITAG
jgi:transcription elongation GreA/GreB family factor